MTPARGRLPEEVAVELTRAVRRWQQLPLDRAVVCAPGVHDLLAELAGERLPDLGPAVLMDQLAVVVYDWCVAGVLAGGESADDDEPGGAGARRTAELAERLATLRLTWP